MKCFLLLFELRDCNLRFFALSLQVIIITEILTTNAAKLIRFL